jgi:phosphate:Na+ symporter
VRASLKIILLVTIFFVTLPLALAEEGAVSPISWGALIMGLVGGLAFFLYGMEQMSEGLKKSAGNQMRSILRTLTKNRVIGLVVGAFVTMVIQSSSATTVMLVSFVQAQLMTFAQTLGVILGADIGTTVTAQLVAFKLTDYALLMVAAGFCLRMFGKKDSIIHLGEAILGFGILFYGMKLMSTSMAPLRTYPEFIALLKNLENPVTGILFAALFTALIQSSSAFTGIVIVLAQQSLITLEAGIPLILGANIGTCITAGLASIGARREAKRVALAHVLFKVAGVLLLIFWIGAFANLVRGIGSHFGSGAARQIANAHTLFNVGIGIIFLPFTGYFAKLILKIMPEKEVDRGLIPKTWHIDDSVLGTPTAAIALARAEITRMIKIAGRMLDALILPFTKDGVFSDPYRPHLSLIQGLDMREEKIDFLEERVGEYLVKIGQKELSKSQMREVLGLMSIVNDIETIGDIIHRNVIPQINKKRTLQTDFSEEGKEEIKTFHLKACKQVSRFEEAFSERDHTLAKRILLKEEKYIDLEAEYRLSHLKRVSEERHESLKTHEVHMELMETFRNINTCIAHIGKTMLEMLEDENGKEG